MLGGATRVLLVEDEASISEPFREALIREGFDPTVAPSVAEARRLLSDGEPDVVVLDLGLPDGDGRDLCRELRGRSSVPIIILTARGTEVDRIVGLELGADDYVVKPFSSGEVIARIRAILRRAGGPGPAGGAAAAAAPAAPLRFGELELDLEGRRVRLGGDELVLARKEFDLLARLAAEPGRVVRREDLMSEVWDENWFGSTKTLDVHVASLRRKLGERPDRARFIHTVRGVGFRFATLEEDES